MTTKYEYARELAGQITDLSYDHPEIAAVYTGRTIVIGQDAANYGNEDDHHTSKEVIPEFTKPIAIFYSIPGVKSLALKMFRRVHLGTNAMSFADLSETHITANRKRFKQRSDVTIFDRNGPVSKKK